MIPSELKPLAHQLDSLSKRKREAAFDQIRALPHEEAIQTLIPLAITRPPERFSRKVMGGVIGSFALLILSIVFGIAFHDQNIPAELYGATTLIFALYCAAYVFDNVRKSYSTWIYPLMSEYTDPLLIQPALWVLYQPVGRSTGWLHRSLIRNLPLLTPEFAATYTYQQRTTLRNLISNSNAELRLAVLNALVRIEGTSAIPLIERMVKREKEPNLKVTAEVYLAQLIEWREKEIASETLLRPSKESHNADSLLRVPETIPDKDSSTLLRPEDPPQ